MFVFQGHASILGPLAYPERGLKPESGVRILTGRLVTGPHARPLIFRGAPRFEVSTCKNKGCQLCFERPLKHGVRLHYHVLTHAALMLLARTH